MFQEILSLNGLLLIKKLTGIPGQPNIESQNLAMMPLSLFTLAALASPYAFV